MDDELVVQEEILTQENFPCGCKGLISVPKMDLSLPNEQFWVPIRVGDDIDEMEFSFFCSEHVQVIIKRIN